MKGKVLHCGTWGGRKHSLVISVDLLKKQIDAVLESNMPEDHKTGVHHLLGDILDMLEEE